MTTPLSATGRISVPYTINGLVHKCRVFVRNPQVVGGSYNINSRATDANDQVWTDALNDLCTTLSYMMGVGTAIGDSSLETQAGGIWTLVATATPSFVNHMSATPAQGYQMTAVFRDILLKKVNLIIEESYLNVLTHVNGLSSLSAGNPLSFLTEFTPAHALTHAPYVWMVGRGNQYLNVAPFVGLTNGTNRRIRRRRSLT